MKNLSMKCLLKNKLFNGDPSFKKTVLLFPDIYRSNSDLLDFNDSDNEVYETNNETDNNSKKRILRELDFILIMSLMLIQNKNKRDKQICKELMKISSGDAIDSLSWISSTGNTNFNLHW